MIDDEQIEALRRVAELCQISEEELDAAALYAMVGALKNPMDRDRFDELIGKLDLSSPGALERIANLPALINR